MQLSKRQLAYLLQQQFNAPTLDQYIRSLAPAAWFRMDQGVTVTGAGISQVDDLSGNARHLLDPGTTRPIYLPYSGTRYLYLPGVSGNYASTPDSVPLSITGDIEIIARLAMNDWTPAAAEFIVNKLTSAGQYSFDVTNMGAAGTIRLRWSNDGTTIVAATSTAATGISDGAAAWLKINLDVDDGGVYKVNFYKAADSASIPTSWTKIGDTVAGGATTSIFDGTNILAIGANGTGASPLTGKIYRAIIKNGIDGTTVVDFNPADASDGATSFASSATGETWTVNSSGSLPAQIVGRASALFNGTSHYLKCNAFTLNQPTCVLMVMKQVSWTGGEYFCDGNTLSSVLIQQITSTPKVRGFAGAGSTAIDLTVGSVGVVALVANGANGVFRVNSSSVSGNLGANNMGGFTMGGAANGSLLSNIQSYETVIFPIAPSTAQLDRLVAGLMARHGLT